MFDQSNQYRMIELSDIKQALPVQELRRTLWSACATVPATKLDQIYQPLAWG